MTEYWLQKKTIGGWSVITWYDNKEQAEANYNKVRQSAGYSYRLVEVTTLQEHRLPEETVIEPPAIEHIKSPKTLVVQPETGVDGKPIAWTSDGWDNINTKPDNHWGKGPSGELDETHGMTGKIWMLSHTAKTRARINPNELDYYLSQGWERGGPKTPFRS